MTSEPGAAYRSWDMWAQLRHGSEFQHVGSWRYANACGTPDPVPVTVTEIAPDDPEATHWGWIKLIRWRPLDGGTELIPQEYLHPEMIWPRRAAFDACFTYGPEAEVEAGKGRIVRLKITNADLPVTRADGEMATVTISTGTLEAALNCLQACAGDSSEPARYREWYRQAYKELAAARPGHRYS